MSLFNIIVGIASIASFIIAIFAVKSIYRVKIKKRISQKARGENIIQSGGDTNVWEKSE